MDQERTFIHHKTGQPTTMRTGNIGAKPEVETPEQYIERVSELRINHPELVPSPTESEKEYTRRKRQEQDLLEELPAVKAEPDPPHTLDDPGIVVEFDGQQIKTLDDLVNVRTPDEKLMDQLYDLSIQVTKASQLVDEFKEYPLSRVVSVLSESHRLVETLGSRLAMAEEITGYYRELINERRKS